MTPFMDIKKRGEHHRLHTAVVEITLEDRQNARLIASICNLSSSNTFCNFRRFSVVGTKSKRYLSFIFVVVLSSLIRVQFFDFVY